MSAMPRKRLQLLVGGFIILSGFCGLIVYSFNQSLVYDHSVAEYLAEINPPNIDYISVGAILNTDTSEPPILGLDPTNPNLLTGKIDDLAVWTRALSADEVSRIYAAGNQGRSLSTVVVEPPVEEAELDIARNGDQITISWSAAGFTLLSSDNVLTGYTPVQGVTGTSYTTTATGTIRFYKLVKN